MAAENQGGRTISLLHPEIAETFNQVFNLILAESDMGAVLISTSVLDNYLRKLFEIVMPASCAKGTKRSLLNYPGPLSSLSAKADVAYSMRLIGKSFHRSIHILREIRNKAAHQPEIFKLDTHKDRLKEMYEIMEGFSELIFVMSRRYIFESFFERLVEEDKKREPGDRFFENKQSDDLYQELQNQPAALATLEGKTTKMELGLGVAWLCAFIVHSWEKFEEKYPGDKLIV